MLTQMTMDLCSLIDPLEQCTPSFPNSPCEGQLEIIPEEGSSGKGSSVRETPVNDNEFDHGHDREHAAGDNGGQGEKVSDQGDAEGEGGGVLGDLLASLRQIGHFEKEKKDESSVKEAGTRISEVDKSREPSAREDEPSSLLPVALTQGESELPDDSNRSPHFKFQAPFLFQGVQSSQASSRTKMEEIMQCPACGCRLAQGQLLCAGCGWELNKLTSNGTSGPETSAVELLPTSDTRETQNKRDQVQERPKSRKPLSAPSQITLRKSSVPDDHQVHSQARGAQESQEAIDYLALANDLQKSDHIESSIEYYDKGLTMANGDLLRSALFFNRSIACGQLGLWDQVLIMSRKFKCTCCMPQFKHVVFTRAANLNRCRLCATRLRA